MSLFRQGGEPQETAVGGKVAPNLRVALARPARAAATRWPPREHLIVPTRCDRQADGASKPQGGGGPCL